MTSTPPKPTTPAERRVLASAADLRIVGLVGAARHRRLLVYAGAGISFGSGLPSGAALSAEIFARLTDLGVAPAGVDSFNLLAVADAVEAQVGGLVALQSVAVGAFPFTSAKPTAPHRALALLLLEGALQVLTTNWDTCIERAAAPERINTIVTTAERLQVHTNSLLKLHGCAERQDTLLITTEQLDAPPVWATTEIESGLAQATVVFLGIGDVAPYVRRGLNRIIDDLGPQVDHVIVVSPTIQTDWVSSKWADLLPSLPTDNKWELAADDFAQGLLAAWINDALSQVRADARDTAIVELPVAFDKLHEIVRRHAADRVLSWMRRCHHRPQSGVGVAHSHSFSEAMLALALHTKADPLRAVPAHGPAQAGAASVDLLIAGAHTSGVALADEAISRAVVYRQDGYLGPTDSLTVICAGAIGPLQASRTSVLPIDVLGDAGPDILSGAPIRLISSHDVLSGAAA